MVIKLAKKLRSKFIEVVVSSLEAKLSANGASIDEFRREFTPESVQYRLYSDGLKNSRSYSTLEELSSDTGASIKEITDSLKHHSGVLGSFIITQEYVGV